MKKNIQLNKWIWKWHFIAGLVSLPFILLLAITGGIYLFKTDYEASKHKNIREVRIRSEAISFDKQRALINKVVSKKPDGMILPIAANHATQFVSGRFSHKNSMFINPYSGKITGEIKSSKTDMHTVRKLHGELLLGKWGTKVVELIACWMVVLLLTGLYIWWPSSKWSLKGFFIPRLKEGKRIFYRDLHAITGFWISGLLLLVLAGGLPWTDVFGSNFKELQKITNTGFPKEWNGIGIQSTPNGKPLSLDKLVTKAKSFKLPGVVTIQFPKGPKGIYSVSNLNPSNLSSQKKIHLDQYSGTIIKTMDWKEVGVLMRGRMWVMAFHQGEFGNWNWWLMLGIAILLFIMCLAAILSYLKRKQKGNWGVPKVPTGFKIDYVTLGIIFVLSIVFPLFGLSIVLIIGYEYYRRKRKLYL